MSEAARIALLQEMMRDAKRNERGGLLACLVGVVVSVAGFSTIPLASNSLELGVVGLVIAAVGFFVYLHYSRLYSRFVRARNVGKNCQKGNLAFVLSADPHSNLKASYSKSSWKRTRLRCLDFLRPLRENVKRGKDARFCKVPLYFSDFA